MNYALLGHDLEHAVQTVIQVFYPNRGYRRVPEGELPYSGEELVVSSFVNGVFGAEVHQGGSVLKKCAVPLGSDKKSLTQAAAAAIFTALTEITGYRPPWGTLTGVRPVKILTEGHPPEYLRDAYLVREDKVRLTAEVSAAEAEFLRDSKPGDVGVYIGIPFCPSKCGYCSFASYPLGRYGGMRKDYLAALSKEIGFLSGVLKEKSITAVYIGGGTPTALETPELEALLGLVRENFRGGFEFTAEAGRPDSLTAEKLALLLKYGVTRLALNPQTMNDAVLKAMGRNHTAAEFVYTYKAAESMGFDNINCDIILGLPGETAEDVRHTLCELEKLAPASVTVHTLAIKRAAEFNLSYGRYGEAEIAPYDIENMLEISSEICRRMGLRPYYMYRQKNMVGNFENVGYARPGTQSVYNHMTMTEARSIYAAGAGAVTKLVNLETNKIKRAFNVKNLDEYLLRVDEMIERKRTLL